MGGRQKIREEAKNWWEEAYNSAAQTLPPVSRPRFHLGIASGIMNCKLCTKLFDTYTMNLQGEASDSDDSDDDDPNTPTLMRNRDGTTASGTKDELRIARQLAKDPWGRFGGHNGKLARIQQQEAAMGAALAGDLRHVLAAACITEQSLVIVAQPRWHEMA